MSAQTTDSVPGDLPATFAERARAELTKSIVPFWWRTLDETNGGVFNCWNNLGTHLVSRDKFTWSQGRFAWLCSRLADAAQCGLIPGNAKDFLRQAEKTVRFLQRHAFLGDGRCAFLLSEEGTVKEAFAGGGPAPSIYADCFVVMGFAEFARVSGDQERLDAAWDLFASIRRRIATGGFPTFPEPIPAGYDAHAIAMITLNVTLVLRDACIQLSDPRLAEISEQTVSAAKRIFDHFMRPDGRIAEMVPLSGAAVETLLARHVNPGHALEGLWMLLTVARWENRADWLERAKESVSFQMARGWDERHGGLLHYVDRLGGPPVGDVGDSRYEENVRTTWDTKLWWVHSEAMYTTALNATLSDSRDAWSEFGRVWQYTWKTFPHPDAKVGEWIQIRDRAGVPLERVVALPVKDPYHITRNLLQLVELFSNGGSGSPL